MKRNQASRPLDGALIGFGKMAEHGHLPGWRRTRRARIRAVCEPDAGRRSRATELLPGARLYATREALFAQERLDFVDVCTPPPFHAQVMTDALDRGLHVLCEKPFVNTRREWTSVLRKCERSGRIAFPVHNWKHAPILARAIRWVRQGHIGRVLHSEFHTLRAQPCEGLTAWRGEKEEAGGGGILLDHGWHGIYLLLNLHAEKPRTVSAWLHPSPARSRQAERSVHLLLGFPTSTATLFLTWEADRRYNASRIYGERGFISLEDDRLILRSRSGRTRVATFGQPLSQGSRHAGWFPPVIRGFLDATGRPRDARREMEEARLCLEITLRAYASARTGGRHVALPEEKGAPER